MTSNNILINNLTNTILYKTCYPEDALGRYASVVQSLLLRNIQLSPFQYIYIYILSAIWLHEENELKLNKFHPTIKFTCDYSRERDHFLDVQVIL